MNCEHIERLLSVPRDLDRAERRLVSEHLRAGCGSCRQAWYDEQRVRDLIRRLPEVAPPPGLEARLLGLPSRAPGPAAGTSSALATRAGALLATTVAGMVFTALVLPRLGGFTDDGSPTWPPVVVGPGALPDPNDTVVGTGATVAPGSLALLAIPRLTRVDLRLPGPPVAVDGAGVAAVIDPAAARPARVAPPAPLSTPVAAAALPDGPRETPGDHEGRSGRRDGSNAGDPDPPAAPPSATPNEPAPTQPVRVCADITVRVFADVAGEGTRAGCPGCDGRWSAEDAAMAAAAGIALPPGLQVAVYDDSGLVLGEWALAGGASPLAEVALARVCGDAPLTVQLVGLATPDWASCPAVGATERIIDRAGPAAADFPLAPRCPLPTATTTLEPASSPTSPTPTPVSELPPGWDRPTATPTTIPPTLPAPRQDPTVQPIGATATPNDPTLAPTLAPIRERPTASATPVARPTSERPGPIMPKITEPPGPPPNRPTPTQEGAVRPRVERLP